MIRTLAVLALLATILACISQPTDPLVQVDCRYGRITPPQDVPTCLHNQSVISQTDRDSAARTIASVAALRDSFRADTTQASFNNAAELTRALEHITDFYSRREFDDSARFHRMMDHLLVTKEYVHGTLRYGGGRALPDATPWLSWQYYANTGIYFQPVNTIQLVVYIIPRSYTASDSILQMADPIYRYALWREVDGRRFPVWEYEFPWNSGGVPVQAPWISGMAQGMALDLFTEAYHRSGNPVWRTRAYQVLNSFMVSWNDGGVLLPDTSHGYWWEEYHPAVQVWNGSVVALISVGYFASVMGDSAAQRMFESGVQAVKYYTPFYDTGSWTLYSRTQGYNSVTYHNFCTRLMDQLFIMTGDPYFKTVADRWRAYVPPPGVH
jgi:D-glucuronyl C5-epimerase-like protein